METELIRRKGIIGAIILVFLGLLVILVFAFRRDILFWVAALGWIIGISGVVFLAIFSFGWRGEVAKLSIGLIILTTAFIISAFQIIDLRKSYELKHFGRETVAVIVEVDLGPCWVCDQGNAVKIRFKDHKGRVVEYWHPCDQCIFADSVIVRYSTLDPHLNEIVRTLP